MFVDIINVFIL